MPSIGETLKRARLKQRLELSAVSARTKISTNYLAAIESDDRKTIPSGFFYKSFVEQYARALSLDTKEISAEVDRVVAEYAPLPLPGQDEHPIQRSEQVTMRLRRRWPFASFASLILVLFGCSAVYAWWHNGKLPMELPQFLSLQKAPDVVEAAKAPERAQPAPVNPPVSAKPVAVAPVTHPDTPAEIETPAPPASPKTQAPVKAAPSARLTPSGRSKFLLDLSATEKTWLSVSSDGKPVFAGILAPRQSKKIIGKQSAKLTVGNAAGLQVRLNGKTIGRLGSRGQVLVVLFTPDNFQIVTHAKEGD